MFKTLGGLKNQLLIVIAKITNYALYKKGVISPFHYHLKKEFLKHTQKFGVYNFYQSYPPLMISGSRATASRFGNYNLENYINKNTEILDIGGNVGFFSAYVSRFVQHIDLVEYNKDLTKIGKKLLDKENITNMHIYNQDFKQFTSNKLYDIVFSFAIHNRVGMEFNTYLEKMYNLMKPGGHLFLESHIFTYNDGDTEALDNRITNFGKLEIIKKGISDDHEGQYREFFILRKK